MIEKVEFLNFKALRDVSLELERFTVLVGPNASGKTSVLEALYCVTEFGGETAPGVTPRWRIPYALKSSGVSGEIRLVCSSDQGVKRVTLGAENVRVRIESAGGKSEAGLDKEAYERGARISAAGRADVVHSFTPAVFLQLEAGRLVAASYSHDPVPQVSSDGQGLPSVLSYLASNQPDDYARIKDSLRSIVPIVREIRFPRAKVFRDETEVIKVDGKEFTRREEREYWGNGIEIDFEGATAIPGEIVSEGTLLVLGLLTVLLGPNRPRLLLLDDLDRALHPKAQRDLMELLRKLLKETPELQIVATSHSPYLLDSVRPEEVRITSLNADGSVAIGRLDEHPKFEKWKEEMSPGEFWSLVGEKWVAEAGAEERG